MWAVWLFIAIGLPTLFVLVLIRLVSKGATVTIQEETIQEGTIQEVFNNVAVTVEALVDNDRMDEAAAQSVLESLINALTIELGWEDVEEAIVEHKGTPFIVQAFENCGYKLSEE